ncbi:MAG: cation:proton antiporter [Deltaproteobacteria bacterium]|nr:cation:proton antiporter [Deltaproteobacteria bacterium]
MDISFVFLIAGLIILIGFLGGYFFDRTRIPDVLLLLGIGILLGPVFGIIAPSRLTHFTEVFGSLALVVILFEGGLDMDIHKLIQEFGTASLLVVVSFGFSMFGIAGYLHFVLGWEWILSLLLGSILGCTSAAIVIPLLARMGISGEVRTILSIESALSDVLAIVCTVSLIEYTTLGRIGVKAPVQALANSFSTAIILGIVVGLGWLKVLDSYGDRKYSYMFTLAAVMITFGAVTFLGGSGAVAVLIFGIILGNAHSFQKLLKIKRDELVHGTIRFFHDEMSFFIRTFFFVYMGMVTTFRDFDLNFLAICLVLLLVIVVVRSASVGITVAFYHEKRRDSAIMLAMLPRGLASAVLATLPAASNVPRSAVLIEITFALIILTNLVMTLGVFLADRVLRSEAEEHLDPGDGAPGG